MKALPLTMKLFPSHTADNDFFLKSLNEIILLTGLKQWLDFEIRMKS